MFSGGGLTVSIAVLIKQAIASKRLHCRVDLFDVS